MYIWRVENRKGIGCYRSWITRPLLEKHLNDDIEHPIPIKDTGIYRNPNGNEICGFINRQQALNWFTIKELVELIKIGFYLKKISVIKVTAIGKKQILAIKRGGYDSYRNSYRNKT